MKSVIAIAATLIFSVSVFCTQSYAQSGGIAADKQKQANLEKNKARQAQMKKKYNAMTPEQQAAARQKAMERKTGGKVVKPVVTPSGKTVPVNPKTAVKPNTTPASAKKSIKGIPGNVAPPKTTGKPALPSSEAAPGKTTPPVKPVVKKIATTGEKK